jgi:signal transduction histidine kinase
MSERPSILIVDDVDANLLAMEALLAALDCNVVSASSGNDALRHLLKQDFAVVLLDVQMPVMDGFEVARLARMNPKTRDVPIIFVTAMHPTEQNVFTGYESGAVDVLFKPVNSHILLSKTRIFLELYRSRKALADEIAAHKHTLAELDAFNYSVSHDLRAPLRPLEGFSTILVEEYADKLDDEGRELLTGIAAAARHMNRLIDDLLRLSRVSRARPSLDRVDLGAMAEAIFAQLRANEAGRNVTLSVMPELVVDADGNLLRIAVDNLLRNAWKFTSTTPAAAIEIGSAAFEKGVVYFVRDNGVGFDPAYQYKLFRAFQRLHSDDEFEGTGIGLAIVQRVIHHHGGKVWAESAPDRGATFYFTLPGHGRAAHDPP